MVLERRPARRKLQSLEYVEIGGEGNGGFLLDLSENGAAVQMAHPVPLEDEIDLRFSLGPGVDVRARGRVTWRDKAGKALGVCFINLADPIRAQISQWLAENENIPGYEWSVPSASPAEALKQPVQTPALAPSRQLPAPLDPPTAGAMPLRSDSRAVHGAAFSHQVNAADNDRAPVPVEPTATFIPVSPAALPGHLAAGPARQDQRSNYRADLPANTTRSIGPDPLAKQNRPISTPYFSLDDAPDVMAAGVPGGSKNLTTHAPDGSVQQVVSGASPSSSQRPWPSKWNKWLGAHATMDGAHTGAARPRRLFKRTIVAAFPTLVIASVLGYVIVHPHDIPGPPPPSSPVLSADPLPANSPPDIRHPSGIAPPPPVVSENSPLGAPPRPESSSDSDIASFDPTLSRPNSAPSAVPRPSLSAAAPSSAGEYPAPAVHAPNDAASSISDPLAGPQPGDRAYFAGMRSMQGEGDTPGAAAAASFFWEAVTQGNPRAEVALGQLYLRGAGVPKNCDQARVLLNAAADRGNPDAPRILASLPSYGCSMQQ